MWNTAVPLPALIAAPLTVTAGPVLAYNVLLTAGIALTAWSGELAAARLVTRRAAAVPAGLLAGFSPYMTAHALGHLNLVVAFLPGLALTLLHDLCVARRRRWWVAGGLLGLAAAAQLLTGEEIVAATLVAGVAGAAVWLVGRLLAGQPIFNASRWRHPLLGLAAAAVTGLALTAWPLYVQLFGPQRTLQHAPGTIMGNDLAGIVAPTTLQALHPLSVPVAGIFSEQNNYLGAPLLVALVAITWTLRRDRVVRWLIVLAALLAVLSLGPHLYLAGRRLPGVLPWRAVTPLPVVNDVLPNRLMLFVYLLGGCLIAIALDRALAASRRQGMLVGAGLALAVLPLLPAGDFPATAETAPGYFTSGVRHDLAFGSVALVTPFSQPDAMLWQALGGPWFRMPEGYARVPGCGGTDTDFTPPGATSRGLASPAAADVSAIRLELAYWRVKEVIVGPGSAAGTADLIARVTGATGILKGGVTVFRVPPAPAPAGLPLTLCQT